MELTQKVLTILNNKELSPFNTFPDINYFEAGETTFTVYNECFRERVKDVTYDKFRPWSGEYINKKNECVKTKTHISLKKVRVQDGIYIEEKSGDLMLRIFQNRNPRFPSLERKIAYVCSENRTDLVSDVLYIYTCENDLNLEGEHCLTKQRILPSESNEIKTAPNNRTTAQAKKVLNQMNFNVTRRELNSLSRGVDTHVKSRVGRKPATDTLKLLDRYSTSKNEMEILKPVSITKRGEKVDIVQLVGYKSALQHFINVLPYHNELLKYREEVASLENLNKVEARAQFNTYLALADDNGSLSPYGNSLFIDTTFSVVSGEFLTLAVAVTDQFKTVSSGKNSSFLIGAMIHTSKSLESHEMFAKFLNELFMKFGPGRRLSSIIHDGEASFRCYNTGVFLKDAVVLRCDLHRSENLKQCFGSDQDQFEHIKNLLFGIKKKNNFQVLLKPGALNSFSKAEFVEKMGYIHDECNNPKAKEWLFNNAENLFERSSMIRKLQGGWTSHWLTTNLIEGRNAALKILIPAPVTARRYFQSYCLANFCDEAEMNDRVKAIKGKTSLLFTSMCYKDFEAYDQQQKNAIMDSFGLSLLNNTGFLTQYPSWFSNGDGKTNSIKFIQEVMRINVFTVVQENDTYITEDGEELTKVVYSDEGRLTCSHRTCKSHTDYTYYMCRHMLSVFNKMEESLKEKVYQAQQKRRSERTFKQLRYRTQRVLDRQKYSKRKGKQFSAHNKPRTYHGIANSSLDSSTIENNCENFSEDDF